MAEDHARAVARIVVAQMASELDFEVIQDSALDALSDILIKYIAEVGVLAHDNCEHAGRNEVNLNDVLPALEDLGATPADLWRYFRANEEVPFAAPIAPFPVQRPRRVPPSFDSRGEEAPSHVPSHLPAFPDTHTHRATPVLAPGGRDAAARRAALVKARRAAEQSLAVQAQQLASAEGTGSHHPFHHSVTWEEAAKETRRPGAAGAAGLTGMSALELFKGLLDANGDGEGPEAGPSAAHASVQVARGGQFGVMAPSGPAARGMPNAASGDGRDAEGGAGASEANGGAEDMDVDRDSGGGGADGGQRGDVALPPPAAAAAADRLRFSLDAAAVAARRRRVAAGALPPPQLAEFQGVPEKDALEVLATCRERTREEHA